MKTLKSVKCDETATVLKLHGSGSIKRRLLDMGITSGIKITVQIFRKPRTASQTFLNQSQNAVSE